MFCLSYCRFAVVRQSNKVFECIDRTAWCRLLLLMAKNWNVESAAERFGAKPRRVVRRTARIADDEDVFATEHALAAFPRVGDGRFEDVGVWRCKTVVFVEYEEADTVGMQCFQSRCRMSGTWTCGTTKDGRKSTAKTATTPERLPMAAARLSSVQRCRKMV